MEFYRSVFGGELTLATFEEYHASEDPTEKDKIMHAQLRAANGITIMAADTPNQMEYKPVAGINMSLSGSNQAELAGYFEKLSAGGQVTMPLERAAWGDTFGMCVDKFGVSWLVNISES
jgi:PhnB protein